MNGTSGLAGWINTTDAEALTGYAQAYVRILARKGQIDAQKVGRDWLVNRESLLAHKAQMDGLGSEKHNPWRQELAEEGRGRQQ
jgi:hypothetical protein